MFTLFYTFLLIYTCLLFVHAEKSDKRWNFNVLAYTFTLVPLSLEGQVPSKILLNRWNHWDSAHFSSLNESEKMYTSMSVWIGYNVLDSPMRDE